MLKKSIFILLVTCLSFPAAEAYSGELKIVVLDVGMGQSILLTHHGHGLLIDTGLAEYSPQVLARMDYYGVQTLDYLVLSHLHSDHAAGYFEIRKAWPDAPVLGSCYVPERLLPEEEAFLKKFQPVLSVDPLYGCLAAGDTISWQGYELQVLWPIVAPEKNLNHNSLVLLLKNSRGGSLLVMGDVDKSVEKSLIPVLQSILPLSGVNLYVASHHASATSTDPDFLNVVRPQVSIISVGRNNRFGYPADNSVRFLEQYSKTVVRTDRNGEICYTLGMTAVPCK